MRVLHYSFADEFRSETEGFHGFVVLLEIDLFKIFMGFFGTSCTIIIDFSHDDQHIEDHANRISKLRFFLPLFSNKPTYLLISKPFKNFLDKSLFNIVFSELIALVELFGLEIGIGDVLFLFFLDLLLVNSELLSLRFK